MKRFCSALAVLLCGLLLCAFHFDTPAGLRQESRRLEHAASDERLGQLLDALDAADYEAFRGIFLPSALTEPELRALFEQSLDRYTAPVMDYAVIARSRAVDGVESVYRLATPPGDLYVHLLLYEGWESDGEGDDAAIRYANGLVGLRVDGEKGFNAYIRAQPGVLTGTSTGRVVTVIITLIGVAGKLFLLWMIVDVLRSDLRRKPLLVLLCLFERGAVVCFEAQRIYCEPIPAFLSLVRLLSYNTYPLGIQYVIVVPFGATIYCIIRGALKRRAQSAHLHPPAPRPAPYAPPEGGWYPHHTRPPSPDGPPSADPGARPQP